MKSKGQMKLEDINKENIYKVPDGYFENLPMKIQQRTSVASEGRTSLVPSKLWYAIPAMVLVIAGVLWFGQPEAQVVDAETLLASVETTELVSYLDEVDMTDADVLFIEGDEQVNTDSLEMEVYQMPVEESETEFLEIFEPDSI
jgi:hypothetical protein